MIHKSKGTGVTTSKASMLFERILSALFIAVVAIAVLGRDAPQVVSFSSALSNIYLWLMELPFWIGTKSNTQNTILCITIFIIAVFWLAAKKIVQKDTLSARLIVHVVLGIPLATFAFLAQIYFIAFAMHVAIGHYFMFLFAALAAWYFAQKSPSKTREPADYSFGWFLVILALYLHLASVAGRFGAPVVLKVSEWFSILSLDHPVCFRLVMVSFLAGLPLLGMPRNRWSRPSFLLMIAPFFVAAALPMEAGIFTAGICGAILMGYVAGLRGLPAVGWLGYNPQKIVISFVLLSLVALQADTVHYFGKMWRCPPKAHLPSGIKRLSRAAGAFDLSTTVDGTKVLASLRDRGMLVAMDTSNGTTETLIDTHDLGWTTGSWFSVAEPEIISRIDDGRFLIQISVSDDVTQNKILVLSPSLESVGFIEGLPAEGGFSDIVFDRKDRIYLASEFDGNVTSLAADNLTEFFSFSWPYEKIETRSGLAGLLQRESFLFCGVETNKLAVDPDRNILYSLGLWCDNKLRALNLQSHTELNNITIGTHSWDMEIDTVKRLLVIPRFMDGVVLVVNADTLQVKARWNADFGVRPVEIDPKMRMVVVGSLYTGYVEMFDLDSDQSLFSIWLGGHIKGLHLDDKTHRAYVGCNCGIYEIDLKQFRGN